MTSFVYVLEEIPFAPGRSGPWIRIEYSKNPPEWRLDANLNAATRDTYVWLRSMNLIPKRPPAKPKSLPTIVSSNSPTNRNGFGFRRRQSSIGRRSAGSCGRSSQLQQFQALPLGAHAGGAIASPFSRSRSRLNQPCLLRDGATAVTLIVDLDHGEIKFVVHVWETVVISAADARGHYDR